jgi:NDP-sugar pyrophosphorylase family protein
MTDTPVASTLPIDGTDRCDALVLCGGLGTRLRSAVPHLPKALAPVGDRPFLDILLGHLAAQGVRRFVLCVGHRADDVVEAVPRLRQHGEIVISREASPLGTGGALRHALPHVRGQRFIALNGDSLSHIELAHLLGFHLAHRARVSIGLAPAATSSEGGVVRLGAGESIAAFDEKGLARADAFTNVGVYVIERDVLAGAEWPEAFSLEHDVFPRLVGRGLYGYAQPGGFLDIGTPERWRAASEQLETLGGSRVADHAAAERA